MAEEKHPAIASDEIYCRAIVFKSPDDGESYLVMGLENEYKYHVPMHVQTQVPEVDWSVTAALPEPVVHVPHAWITLYERPFNIVDGALKPKRVISESHTDAMNAFVKTLLKQEIVRKRIAAKSIVVPNPYFQAEIIRVGDDLVFEIGMRRLVISKKLAEIVPELDWKEGVVFQLMRLTDKCLQIGEHYFTIWDGTLYPSRHTIDLTTEMNVLRPLDPGRFKLYDGDDFFIFSVDRKCPIRYIPGRQWLEGAYVCHMRDWLPVYISIEKVDFKRKTITGDKGEVITIIGQSDLHLFEECVLKGWRKEEKAFRKDPHYIDYMPMFFPTLGALAGDGTAKIYDFRPRTSDGKLVEE